MLYSAPWIIKASFPLGEFVRANREKSNLIGLQETLTTSPSNHIHFLLVRMKNGNHQMENSLNNRGYCTNFSTDDGIIWSSGAASIKDCHVFVDEGITKPKSKNHSRKMLNNMLDKKLQNIRIIIIIPHV